MVPQVSYERRTADIYKDSDRIATYDVTAYLAGIDLGSQFTRYGELRLGVSGGMLSPELDTGPQELSPGEDDIQQGAFTARLFLDQLNSTQFPRSGWQAGAKLFNSISVIGADEDYTKWDMDGTFVTSFGQHTFNLGMKAGGNIGSDELPRYDLFQWGGFLQQSGYATGQLMGDSLWFSRLMYYHRILKGSLLEGIYGGFSLEVGEVGGPLVAGGPEGILESGCVFIAADSPIGPMYLGYGQALDNSNNSFYFFLGRPY